MTDATARDTPSDRGKRSNRWRAVGAVSAVGVVPWSIQRFVSGEILLRFAWGQVSFEPAFVVSPLWIYPLASGVPLLTRWVLGVACWVVALASAVSGFLGVEDRRLTAGSLVVAGLANVAVAGSFSVQPGRIAYPVGSLAAFVVACWLFLTRS